MPNRYNRYYTDKSVVVGGKIRKRGNCYSSPSSNSSTSFAGKKNNRFKRAILVGRRACSSTPVPAWKMAMRSPAFAAGDDDKQLSRAEKATGKQLEAQLSARRLAATLWEINGGTGLRSPSVPVGVVADGDEDEDEEEEEIISVEEEEIKAAREKKQKKKKELEKMMMLGAEFGRSTHLLDHSSSHSPVYEKKDGSNKPTRHRRLSSSGSQKLQLTEYIGGVDSFPNGGSVEVASSHHSGALETALSIKTCLKDVSSSLKTSKELVKLMLRLWGSEEAADHRNSSRLTLLSALRVELDRAKLQVNELVQEHRANLKEINSLLKHFTAQKAAWKSKEQDRIMDAVSSVSKELEAERKLRKRAERLNKRLGRELADTRDQLSEAAKKLGSERRAREILEQTCEELARGVKDDKAEVEEMKRESAKVREEVERERQMLQLADVLREERVQMKLQEARYEYEEKNAALERLRNELEIYLHHQGDRDQYGDDKVNNKRDIYDGGDEDPTNSPAAGNANFVDGKKVLADFLGKLLDGSCSNGTGQHNIEDGELEREREEEEEDSGDSELCSIELNMENLNKIYKWSLPSGGVGDGNNNNNNNYNVSLQGDSRRASVEEVFKGRRSLSEKIQWESICLQKKTSNGNSTEWDFNKKQQLNNGNNATEKGGRSLGASSQGERIDQKSHKDRRDRVLLSLLREGSSEVGSATASPKGFGVEAGDDEFESHGNGGGSKR